MFGNPETTPAAGAEVLGLGRLEIRRSETSSGEEAVGARASPGGQEQVAPPFRRAEFDIIFEGISYEGDLIDQALSTGDQQERQYSATATSAWGGRENAREFHEHPRPRGDRREDPPGRGSCPLDGCQSEEAQREFDDLTPTRSEAKPLGTPRGHGNDGSKCAGHCRPGEERPVRGRGSSRSAPSGATSCRSGPEAGPRPCLDGDGWGHPRPR